MAKLILSLDGMVLREYPLTKERTTIGRKSHNDIVIDNLAISGEHAMIMTILNDSFLEDLGSTNGTLVNGQPIKKHFLQNNDVVELGKYKLKYVSEATAAQAGPGRFREDHGAACASRRRRQARARQGRSAEASQPPSKNFGDTVVNPEMMHSQTTGGTLRDAARQAAAAGTRGSCSNGPATASPPAPAAGCTTPAAGAAAAPRLRRLLSQPPAAARSCGRHRDAARTGLLGQRGSSRVPSRSCPGPSAGKELPLSKPLTTLGKPGVQVAVIAKRPQGYFITHVEGASFPVVNGKQLDAQAHALERS